MAERTVPAYVPRFEDANMVQSWDYARPERPAQAETWASLVDYRDHCMIESAAGVLRCAGDGADLAGVLAFLWGAFDEDNMQEFIDEHFEEIEIRRRGLKS